MALLAKVVSAAPYVIAMAASAQQGQIVNHCRPDGAGGFVCRLEREPPKGPPPLTPEDVALMRKMIQGQIPTIPYTMTPDQMTDMERNGGTASNEERIAERGSQLEVCEDRLDKMGYPHITYAGVCAGLSVKAPTPAQQKAFDQENAAKFQSMLDEQRKRGEALRDEIAKHQSDLSSQPKE